MDPSVTDQRQDIRQGVRALCRDFPDAYWREIDKHEQYPQGFVDTLTASGYLAALVPEGASGRVRGCGGPPPRQVRAAARRR